MSFLLLGDVWCQSKRQKVKKHSYRLAVLNGWGLEALHFMWQIICGPQNTFWNILTIKINMQSWIWCFYSWKSYILYLYSLVKWQCLRPFNGHGPSVEKQCSEGYNIKGFVIQSKGGAKKFQNEVWRHFFGLSLTSTRELRIGTIFVDVFCRCALIEICRTILKWSTNALLIANLTSVSIYIFTETVEKR